jgi:arylformamidase
MIDITRAIHNDAPNWFGDTPVNYQIPVRISDGASANVGSLSMSTHTGTHVDAPWHYDDGGIKLHQVPLETWVGTCVVVNAIGVSRLTPDLLEGIDLNGVSKVLFKTGQPNAWLEFPKSWAVTDPSLPPFLAARGISLIGVDAPSADELTSKDLPGHRALAKSGVCILESLALADVEAGRYRLICLPLNLIGADGAPARVILELEDSKT